MNKSDSQTERMDPALLDLDQRSSAEIVKLLVDSQRQAIEAVEEANAVLIMAVDAAATRLGAVNENPPGRLILAGAGASGRLAVQDGAELWPTYGWPHDRLVLCMAGGDKALVSSVEGVEDDISDAANQITRISPNGNDVIVALAASGRSPWTCKMLELGRQAGSLTIGLSNNSDTPLLELAEHPVFLNSGSEVLAGSTRMSAGTAQKAALNVFSTTLMIRLNRTYGNLMVDMAAVNHKLDDRRVRMLLAIDPGIPEDVARTSLETSDGWVKLATLVAKGLDRQQAADLLEQHQGSLRQALQASKF